MRAFESFISKRTRRTIFWLLFGVTLAAPVAVIVLSIYRDPFERHYFLLFRMMGAAIGMLLFWCAAYRDAEPFLVRFALVALGIIFAIVVSGVELPQFSHSS